MSSGSTADLRAWLRQLDARGQLAVARPEAGLLHEIAAIAKSLEREQAVLFPAPRAADRTHHIPVVANLFVDRPSVAAALGVPDAELLDRFLNAARNPIAPVEVARAPAQDVVHEAVDIERLLPIPTHNELDSGAYITAALLIARDPDTGIQNIAIHRCQISGPDRIGVLLLPRHTQAYYRRAEQRGMPLEIALVVGVHPAFLLASQAIAALDEDEMGIAGALLGAPAEVVKCRTNNVRVPAHAEIVLEGRLLPGVREPEGPFGEFPQYYGPRAAREVIEIDAVTHRRDPIFHTIVGGGFEHLILGGVPREATLLQHLRRSFPNVLDVRLTRGGTCRYHLVVKIEKLNNGEPKNIMMGAFAGHYDVKQVVVVDKDVDIDSAVDIEWAVATRFQPDRDLLVVGGAQGSRLDPSADDGVSAKMGLDATAPLGQLSDTYRRIHVPGEDRVDRERSLEQGASVASRIAAILGETRA
ncbi:MAG: UbiD family decarboxylase [Hyphomicrobiaceae bacterium]|nr:UbiD family decarboxylase [Hyphomicrobiaceae bacterium]